jgi:hypothetical protein
MGDFFDRNAGTLVLAAVMVAASTGCIGLPTGVTRSRWAMSDPEYAEKYADGAEKTDIPGKVKQAADARFIEGASGYYASVGFSSFADSENPMGALELGFEGYATSYFTTRAGLIAAVNADDLYFGGELGARLQPPTRLAPFVGVGAFAGYAEDSVPAENDNVDNDDDGSVDEWGEEKDQFTGVLAAMYPETGVHFWWTPNVRISGMGRYLITSEGRDADGWYYTASIAFFTR